MAVDFGYDQAIIVGDDIKARTLGIMQKIAGRRVRRKELCDIKRRFIIWPAAGVPEVLLREET